METIQQLNDAIAAERQQFQDYKTTKEGEISALNTTITERDATIADLQQQLTNAGIPDGTTASIGTIVEP
jgi:uncharacterized coiled-coil protein SlyX